MILRGKKALVTGGGRGIGAAVALELASRGAHVAITYLKQSAEAQKVLDSIQGMGVKGLAFLADAADSKESISVVGETRNTFDGLDILVNNAGTSIDSVSWRMSLQDWQRVVDVNLTGCFNYCTAAIPEMRSQGHGKIVNMTSINGIRGKAGQSNYAAAKAGVIALTRSLARELGPKNINVNAVAPGLIQTDMTAHLDPDIVARATAETALGRLGKPSDVANLVVFLASDLAAHITGQVVNVDGGQLMA